MTGNRGTEEEHMFSRKGQPGSGGPLNQRGPSWETSDESATSRAPALSGRNWLERLLWIIGSHTIHLGFIKNKGSREQGNHSFLRDTPLQLSLLIL